MLLTKAMRERNEVKTILRYYRFVLVRIRTPDNYVLQGTFRPSESLSGVRQFVLSALASEAFPFNLVSTGLDLSDDTATLAELGLVSKPSLMYGT
jgi:UBX domain-containing protein 6